jgi:hypothetical protein
MSHEPENELLDHTLRDTFSEFELPPGQHVWTGIEGRIAALPKARRALPLKLLLPAVALVGVGVGWLLPRPAFFGPTPPVPVPTVLQPPTMPETVMVASRMPLEKTPPPMLAAADVVAVPVSTRQYASTSAHRPAALRAPAAVPPAAHVARPVVAQALETPPAPESATSASTESTVSAAAFMLPAADSAAFGTLASLSSPDSVPVAVAGAAMAPLTAPVEVLNPRHTAAASPKTESQQEVHTEFRQPTHRMAERGRGIRRRLSAVAVWARQVVSPRRARATGQPNF